VFVWGLQYKLSLYDPPQSITHKIPAAKLLSKNEQAAGADTVATVNANHGPATMLIVFFSCVLIALCSDVSLIALTCGEVTRPWLSRQLAAMHRFSFRPPPIFA
jgi:hypothetical protein